MKLSLITAPIKAALPRLKFTVLLDGEIPYNEASGISLPLYYRERRAPDGRAR